MLSHTSERATMESRISQNYDGRRIYRLYLSTEAATALGVLPDVQGRLRIDTDDPRIDFIEMKLGWIVIGGGPNSRARRYLNPAYVVVTVWDTDADLPEN